jgi:hypothetical protein
MTSLLLSGGVQAKSFRASMVAMQAELQIGSYDTISDFLFGARFVDTHNYSNVR